MNHQSDFGYSTGAVSMRCIACGSDKINCCDGHGRKFTHGCGDRSLVNWERGIHPIPRYIALACAAISHGLPPMA